MHIIIFACVLLSIILANSPLAPVLQSVLDLTQPWINDGLMTIFFLLVGLEIKREVVTGNLSTPRKAFLPILCAAGGAITPAIIYFTINHGLPTQRGWGIPMATDIAFALAIIGMLSKTVPPSLKIFLAALAIADDLMAILVIALFYAGKIHIAYLLGAAGVATLLYVFNRLRLNHPAWYLAPGVLLWYLIHHSGIHATIAGVITALFIPIRSKTGSSPLEDLEHFLTRPVNYIIVPLFAFANTNIHFGNAMIAGLVEPSNLGIMLGLFIGKPLGILLTAFAGIKSGICELPEKAGWRHIAGAGALAGIGFTMSIFMTLLSFSDDLLITKAKFAVLSASLLSVIAGYCILRKKDERPS